MKMKIQNSIYALSVTFFALALSSCSCSYGCGYGATELKPLDQPEELVLITNEDNEIPNESIETETVTR